MGQNDLTKGPIGKSILVFLLPLLASTLIQQLYNTVDLIFVGKFCGTKATAAIGASSLIITCFIGFFNGMAVGTNVVAAFIYGKQDKKGLKNIIQTVFIFGLLGGLTLTVIGIYFTPIFLRYMNTPDSILDIAVKYLRIYTLSIISVVIYNLLCGILRAIGDSKSPMIFQMFGGIVNVVADFIFIVILKKGVEGAAIATLLSQTLTAILTIICFYRRTEDPKLSFIFSIFDKKIFKRILIVGIPAGVQSIVITLSNIIIQSQINSFGVDAIAAFTAYFKVELILYLPIIVLGQALVSFVGQNYGANKYDRINKGVKCSIITSAAITAVIGILMMINSDIIFSIFTSNREVMKYGKNIVSITFPFYFLYAILECLSSKIRGRGISVPPMVITVFSFCGVRIILLIALLRKYNSISSIAATYPISWLFAVMLTFMYSYYAFSKDSKEAVC
ncbi:MATE family efflux transporter [Terrisporobacter sp.]